MDYALENLGPERFQELCQALLIREQPDVQAFPVAQPDGGRDAVRYSLRDRSRREFIVFQVKFVREPAAHADRRDWLEGVIDQEVAKVSRLRDRGATDYYLLTNVRGTAHLDSGAIDRLNQKLQEKVALPSMVWWRDDINRRLDDAWDLKWAYSEVMTPADVLRAVLEAGLGEDRERRTSAIRSFLAHQYQTDAEVRFKQVELQNRLLDLFVDVPVRVIAPRGSRAWRHKQMVLWQLAQDASGAPDTLPFERAGVAAEVGSFAGDDEPTVGAATFLLHGLSQQELPQVVIEGAPGQGKSTLAQYLCQVHRMRLLDKRRDLSNVPDAHSQAPIRLPFRVDLRDLALWLNRGNPFTAEADAAPPAGWERSLEAFLAAQVAHDSGGTEFSVSDLHAVARVSAILLVLDGLDEVADIGERGAIVDEVTAAANRLREVSASLQVVVTSRPAAFANSPGFAERVFRHLELASITPDLISDYSERWIRARRLAQKEAGDVRRILRSKMSQPHMRDLARNPMQLAILLSLINRRGTSLPDKRTALYDSYVGLFFDREAEKSPVVREHRDLLIDIHRYLGWLLHSAVEEGNSRGSISTPDLQRALEGYLAHEGRDTTLVADLFHGLVERVVALVSRVEGTYEFEVQPLREYFAARHLYETAPYSPPGAERPGEKTERLDALARNFYWLNVMRFYAGCYSKGELPSLVDRLEVLAEEDGFRETSHPRVLAVMLLMDWVFTQHPKSMQAVIALALDGLGQRHALADGTGIGLVLPRDAGRDQLVARCLEIFEKSPGMDYAIGIARLFEANTSLEERKIAWLDRALAATGTKRTAWLQYGRLAGVLGALDQAELDRVMEDRPNDVTRLVMLMDSGQVDYCESEAGRIEKLVDSVLDQRVRLGRFDQPSPSPITDLSQVFSPSVPYPDADFYYTRKRRKRRRSNAALHKDRERAVADLLTKAALVRDKFEAELQRPDNDWATCLDPWNRVVEASRRAWGERWAHYVMATTAAGIKSRDPVTDASDLYDRSSPLCSRARLARLRAGHPDWWRRQLDQAPTRMERAFCTGLALTWCGPRALVELIPTLDSLLERATAPEYGQILTSTTRATQFGESIGGRRVKLNMTELPPDLSARTVVAVSRRLGKRSEREIYLRYLESYEGEDTQIVAFCHRVESAMTLDEPSRWSNLLDLTSRAYAKGVILRGVDARQQWADPRRRSAMPLEVAQKVARDAERYPSELVKLAEGRSRQAIAETIRPVGEVARDGGWFEEPP